MLSKKDVLQELMKIPGVGKSIAEDLWNLNIHTTEDLKDENPEILYKRLCAQQVMKIDRCMLYVFRCAVYYASNQVHDPEMLKWWNWKDR